MKREMEPLEQNNGAFSTLSLNGGFIAPCGLSHAVGYHTMCVATCSVFLLFLLSLIEQFGRFQGSLKTVVILLECTKCFHVFTFLLFLAMIKGMKEFIGAIIFDDLFHQTQVFVKYCYFILEIRIIKYFFLLLWLLVYLHQILTKTSHICKIILGISWGVLLAKKQGGSTHGPPTLDPQPTGSRSTGPGLIPKMRIFFINFFGGQIETNLMIIISIPTLFKVRNSMVNNEFWSIQFFSHTFNSFKHNGLMYPRLNVINLPFWCYNFNFWTFSTVFLMKNDSEVLNIQYECMQNELPQCDSKQLNRFKKNFPSLFPNSTTLSQSIMNP
ncbi:hypothetical protein VP01_4768g3 [Puccinia sorghi]|uniref:Uncharacterized protein n=1 Tax=Puccinia sorghi TaxID=27349 RepID=A0A0L6UMP7_9BASI|nr:hypothetical protein VP01_4768g3 [Puccinia sorghi]